MTLAAWAWWPVLVAVLVATHLATTATVRWADDRTVRSPPRPLCVATTHRLAWHAVVPVVSWIRHRGACTTCGHRVPTTLLVVEVATMVVLVAGIVTHDGWDLLLVLPMLWSAVVATPIDLAKRIIPNRLTHPQALWSLAVATLLAATTGQWGAWRLAMVVGFGVALGLLAVSLLYELVRGQPGIGMGDIKWGLSIGTTVGWLGIGTVLVWLYATVVVSLVAMLALVATGRARIASRVPYGPYLAVGAVVGILFADPVLDLLSR